MKFNRVKDIYDILPNWGRTFVGWFFRKSLINNKYFLRQYKELIEYDRMTPEEKENNQLLELRKILINSYENTKYYRQLFDSVHFDPYRFNDIKDYYNIPAILQGVAIFVLIKYSYRFIEKNEKLVKVIGFLKDYTFAFYLLHWFIIRLITEVTGLDIYSIYWRLFGFIPVALISILVTWILRKIKIGKYILP